MHHHEIHLFIVKCFIDLRAYMRLRLAVRKTTFCFVFEHQSTTRWHQLWHRREMLWMFVWNLQCCHEYFSHTFFAFYLTCPIPSPGNLHFLLFFTSTYLVASSLFIDVVWCWRQHICCCSWHQSTRVGSVLHDCLYQTIEDRVTRRSFICDYKSNVLHVLQTGVLYALLRCALTWVFCCR